MLWLLQVVRCWLGDFNGDYYNREKAVSHFLSCMKAKEVPDNFQVRPKCWGKKTIL